MNKKEITKAIANIKGICDAIGDGISIQDTDFIILFQNKALVDIIGNKTGKYCYKAYEDRDHVCKGCPMAKVFEDGKVHYSERSAMVDGIMRHVEITVSALKNSSGKVIAGIETIRDITEKKTERNTIFNLISDAITIHDTEFNIINANKAARKLFGSRLKNAFSQKCFKTYHGTEQAPHACPSCRVLKTGKPSSSEIFEPHLNKYIEIRAFPRFDKRGNIVGLLHIVRDISKRREYQTELEKSERELIIKVDELQQSNIAFKHLLTQRDNDKRVLEERILANVKHFVFPYINKLKKSGLGSKERSYINIIDSNLKELISPFAHKLSSHYFGLSSQEIKIAGLIRDGNRDKDIADILHVSLETVKTHRHNIRKKLGILRKKINLQAYLSLLDK